MPSSISSLSNISGKQRLKLEDICWVLSDLGLLGLRGDEPEWEDFCCQLLGNNLETGNLLVLVEKATYLLREVNLKLQSQRMVSVSWSQQVVPQCCVHLHVVTLLLHHLARTLTDQQVKEHKAVVDIRLLFLVLRV